MPGPRIEYGDRVGLRTVERADAAFLQRSYANPELRERLGRNPKNETQVDTRIEEVIEDTDNEYFVVCLEDADAPPGKPNSGDVTPIGIIVARHVTYRPNLAIWILPEYHGEGYGKEAASMAIDTIFRTYDVPSIGAGVYDFNEASKALLESLGFTQEGRQRKVQFYDGEYHDNLKYGLLREEWSN